MIICAVFVLVDPYHGQFFSDKPIEESDCDQNAEYKCPVRPWHLKKKISANLFSLLVLSSPDLMAIRTPSPQLA